MLSMYELFRTHEDYTHASNQLCQCEFLCTQQDSEEYPVGASFLSSPTLGRAGLRDSNQATSALDDLVRFPRMCPMYDLSSCASEFSLCDVRDCLLCPSCRSPCSQVKFCGQVQVLRIEGFRVLGFRW